MPKEMDETEGFEFTDLEAKAKEVQSKMTDRHSKENADVTLDDLDKEPVMLEGGDDEWKKTEGSTDLEYTGDEKEEVEEEKEEEVKEEEKKELSAEEGKDKESFDQFIRYMDEEGGGTKYIVKGKEYDLKDLSPQEWKDRQSKADRFYQAMEEVATQRKELEERERLAEQGARQSQEIMSKYGVEGKTDTVKIPKGFQAHDDDTENERALKEANATLYTEVQNLKTGLKQQAENMTENELYRQLDIVTKEFPMASKEEVVATKWGYPEADIRSIAERSHNNRISDKYIESVLEARPDKLREIEEKAVEKHLAKKQKATRVSRKISSSTVSSKTSTGKKAMPRTLDEIEARLDKERPHWDFEEEM